MARPNNQNQTALGTVPGGRNAGLSVPISPLDVISDVEKVTSGYFPGGGGQINAGDIYSGSLSDANEAYYFNVYNGHTISASSQTIFSVAYGHDGGSGSKVESTTKGETEAIYKQWANILLPENEITGGFYISAGYGDVTPSAAAISTQDRDIYAVVAKRSLMKDRVNKKTWIFALTGSTTTNAGTGLKYFTDDSATRLGKQTPAGPRFNVVSCSSNGTVAGTGAGHKIFGHFWPNYGVWILSATEMSASIPGYSASKDLVKTWADPSQPNGLLDSTASIAISASKGFAPNVTTDYNPNNALGFVNCLKNTGAFIKARDEEDQISTSYFCRVRASEMNFSNSPTYVSGSLNYLRHKTMWSNPQTFITQLALHNEQNQIVAIGSLSTPIQKNFGSEATVKVKLTY